MARVYVSIGSNIDRAANVRSALAALERRFGPLTRSRVYESEAVGFAGDPFYNLVVAFDTDEPPQRLAEIFHSIEDDHGRVRGGDRFAARTLDLDLLLYDHLCMREGRMHLPRDEITRYAFVLLPLAEIAPGERHPENGRTYADLWAEFEGGDQPLWPVELE